MLLSRRWGVSGGGRSPRKRRASVAATARRSRPSVSGRWGASRRLSRRGGGVRVAVVDRDRERASIGPPSAAKPHLLWHWISPNRHRGTRTGAVLSAQVVVRRAQRALRYVSTSFSRRCRQRSCVFAASSSLAKTRGTRFFFLRYLCEENPLSLDDERRRPFPLLKLDGY